MSGRVSHLLPPGVEFPKSLRGYSQLGDLARLLVFLQGSDDGFSHGDELFLLLRVGEAAPLVHVAQFLHPRRHGFLLGAQPGECLTDVFGDLAAGGPIDGRGHVSEEAFAFAERDGL